MRFISRLMLFKAIEVASRTEASEADIDEAFQNAQTAIRKLYHMYTQITIESAIDSYGISIRSLLTPKSEDAGFTLPEVMVPIIALFATAFNLIYLLDAQGIIAIDWMNQAKVHTVISYIALQLVIFAVVGVFVDSVREPVQKYFGTKGAVIGLLTIFFTLDPIEKFMEIESISMSTFPWSDMIIPAIGVVWASKIFFERYKKIRKKRKARMDYLNMIHKDFTEQLKNFNSIIASLNNLQDKELFKQFHQYHHGMEALVKAAETAEQALELMEEEDIPDLTSGEAEELKISINAIRMRINLVKDYQKQLNDLLSNTIVMDAALQNYIKYLKTISVPTEKIRQITMALVEREILVVDNGVVSINPEKPVYKNTGDVIGDYMIHGDKVSGLVDRIIKLTPNSEPAQSAIEKYVSYLDNMKNIHDIYEDRMNYDAANNAQQTDLMMAHLVQRSIHEDTKVYVDISSILQAEKIIDLFITQDLNDLPVNLSLRDVTYLAELLTAMSDIRQEVITSFIEEVKAGGNADKIYEDIKYALKDLIEARLMLAKAIAFSSKKSFNDSGLEHNVRMAAGKMEDLRAYLDERKRHEEDAEKGNIFSKILPGLPKLNRTGIAKVTAMIAIFVIIAVSFIIAPVTGAFDAASGKIKSVKDAIITPLHPEQTVLMTEYVPLPNGSYRYMVKEVPLSEVEDGTLEMEGLNEVDRFIASIQPAVEETFDNGFRVVVKENRRADYVSINIPVFAGGNLDHGDTGIAHFLEHCLFLDTKNRTKAQLVEDLTGLGAKLNAFTNNDRTQYFINVPTQHFEEAMEIISDMLRNMQVTEENFEIERGVIIKEIQQRREQGATRRLIELMSNVGYKRSLYYRTVLGTKDTIQVMTLGQLMHWYRKHYVANNMSAVIAGNIDPQKAIEITKKYFGDMESGDIEPDMHPVEPPVAGFSEHTITWSGMPKDKQTVWFVWQTPRRVVEESALIDIVGQVLSAKDALRLFSIVEEKQLAMEIGAYNSQDQYRGQFFVYSDTKPEDYEKLRDAVIEEVQKFLDEGFKPGELDRIKTAIKAMKVYGRESIKSQASELLWGAPEGYAYVNDAYLARVLAATEEEVMDAARKYLKKDLLTIGSIKAGPTQDIPAPDLDPRIEITQYYPEHDTAAEQWIVDFENRMKLLNKAVKKTEVSTKRLEPVKKTFSNDAQIFVSQANNVPSVSVTAVINGGKRIEDLKTSGYSNMLAEIMGRGPEGLTYEELNEALADRGASVGVSASGDHIVIEMQFQSEHTDFFVKLLSDMITKPGFRGSDLEKLQYQTFQQLMREQNSPFGIFGNTLRPLLFKDHPYSMNSLGTEENIKAITVDKLRSFYNEVVNPQNLKIAFSGDVDADKIIPAMEEYLSVMKKTDAPVITLSDENAAVIEGVVKEEVRFPIPAAVLTVTFPAAPQSDDDRFIFAILDKVLGNFPTGRIV
ncbi:M16 family metallopeptidase, partial [Elusimicrobiota bacterium]